ncbi:hypothetical protein [Solitalea koreensis]|uniref:Uncharacterized protein n=1 Tax=Solitalea koreensis TaxID=543615 RepID=A0A521DKX0_9SPHI|nr:hypothetical protein [Solitalea koreensis]SMO72374.1 hypothetical protein SAMN06265350_107111 [Solitalea koreensis]
MKIKIYPLLTILITLLCFSACEKDPLAETTAQRHKKTIVLMGDEAGGWGDPYDPCGQANAINTMVSNSVISDQHDQILERMAQDHANEYGVDRKLQSIGANTYVNSSVHVGSGTHYPISFTWNSTAGYTISSSHGHPDDVPPSPADATVLAAQFNNTQFQNASESEKQVYKDNASLITITATHQYVITVTDWEIIQAKRASFEQNQLYYNELYQEYASEYVLQLGGDYEQAGTYALLKMYGDCINVYASTINSTDFIPQRIYANSVLSIPCN